jgi:predicted DCC family thiol-disulfide oxidoreductase YuxK
MATPASEQNSVVLYDGHCALCNRMVRFLLKIDRRQTLTFASLTGPTAQRLMPRMPADFDAIVYHRQGQPLTDSSSAILTILGDLGLPWSLFKTFLWIPPVFRDAVYRFIAQRRYKIFGHYDSCPLPDASVRNRFLD